MGLFGLGGDSTDGSGSSAGFLMPMAAQAMQADPRTAMIQSIMQTGQQQLQQPTYSPLAALAKALTVGIGGASSGYLQSQYADAAKGAPQEIGAALSSSDPLTTLTQSKNPIARMMGFQLAPTIMAKRLEPQKLAQGDILTTAAGGAPLASNKVPLSPQGRLAADMGGRDDPIAAAANLKTAETNATNQSDLQYKPAIAGKTAIAEIPGKVGAAVQTAAGTAPIDTFKEMFKPQVNRVTGEISIPGVVDPAIVQRTMAAFGVTPQSFGGTHIAGAPAPVTNGTPVPSAPSAPPPAQTGLPITPQAPGPMPVQSPLAARAQPNQTPPAPSAAALGVASPPQQGSPTASPQAAVPQPQPQKPSGPVPIGAMNPMDEVPKVPLPTGEMPTTAGTISPGRDPIAIKAGEEAVEQGAKQYEEAAAASTGASNIHSQLATMRTVLQNGGVDTNALAPIKATVSSYLNAVLGPAVAKQATGIDPAQAEVFNKDATRMGLSFARQTEGAREAVAAIKIALGANPSLANTMQGNKTIIDLLDAGAQRDMAAQQYSDAWFQKNNSYVGAQGWFNKNHPAAEFTSKVIPYNLPRTQGGGVQADKLEPNVTYNITSQNHTGPAIWTGQGFMPVQQ